MALQRNLSLLVITIILLVFSSIQASAGAIPRLERLPVGERWFGLYFDDERSGFSYVGIREVGAGYELHSDSCVKMGNFAFSRNATIRETYLVNPDLTLRSFSVDQTIDGKWMTLKGETSPSGVKTVVETAGSKKEKLLKIKGAVYPPMAMNLIPLFKGIEPGKVYRVSMLDTEAVKIKKVKITAIGPDTVGNTKAIHLLNDLYPVSNDIWVDYQGNTIKESVRDGWIVTRSEEEKTIRQFIAESALAKRDFILGYSRIGTNTTISQPSKVRKMVLELTGLPVDARLPQGLDQKEEETEGGKLVVTVDNSPPASKEAAVKARELADYLEPTESIPSADPDLSAKKTEITGDEAAPEKIIGKLASWVAGHVKETTASSGSPMDTIRKGEGDCLAHARLYASLARAAGIPTKIILGLAYFKDQGFLYHCWAESYAAGKWLPVDPTSGEVPADATHVKLVEGDIADDFIALSGFVGKIKAKVLAQQ